MAGEGQLSAGIADVLLIDEDGFLLDVQVRPEEGYQFTLSEAADQRQIEHR